MAGRAGSNGRVYSDIRSGAAELVPQNDLDRALVQAVYHQMQRSRRAAFAGGDVARGRLLAGIQKFASTCGRDLQNRFRVLTEKQRNALIKWAPPDKREKFRHPGAPPVPEVLKNLPLKPPTRRVPDEDE